MGSVGWFHHIITTKTRSYYSRCSFSQTTHLSPLSSPTQYSSCKAQQSTFTVFSCLVVFLESFRPRIELRALRFTQTTMPPRLGGGRRKTQASVFVCILFQNIKLNQSFNTLDCINMGENRLNKYQEWKWISRRRLLSMWFIYECHGWFQNRQHIKNTEIMCLDFFIFFFLSERINIGIYITFTFLSKSSWVPLNLSVRPVFIRGCQDNCGNYKKQHDTNIFNRKIIKTNTRGQMMLSVSQSACDG